MRGFSLRRVFSFRILSYARGIPGACVIVFFQISAATSGAFNQPRGEGLLIAGGSAMQGDFTFGANGKLAKTPPYRKGEFSLYLEYGVTDWLTVLARPAAETVSVGAPTRANISGLGDSQAGLQIKLFTYGEAVFALRATAIAPGHPGSRSAAAVGHTAGAAQGDLVAGYAFSLFSWPSFIEGSAGYRWRAGRYDPEWRADQTFGVRPRPDILLLLKASSVLAAHYEGPALNSAYALKAQAGLVYDLNAHWSLEAGGFATLIGRNALRERGVTAAVWRRF